MCKIIPHENCYQKIVDDIEIGNSYGDWFADELTSVASPLSSPPIEIRSSSSYRYPWPSSAAPSDPPPSSSSHPRAIRVRVSAVRLEHVPTFLFFMCTTPRAMGIPSYYLYRQCDFSFSRSPSSPCSQIPPSLPILVSLSATDGYIWVPDIHRSLRDLSLVPY